jgi:hypothetical protein
MRKLRLTETGRYFVLRSRCSSKALQAAWGRQWVLDFWRHISHRGMPY